MNKLLGIVLLLLLPLQQVNANGLGMTMRIIGGVPATQKAWPAVVAIKTSQNQLLCGGTMLDPIWVLTAAHCIRGEAEGLYYEYGIHDLKVFSGATGFDSPNGRTTDVQRLIVHPGYNPNNGVNDIALIMLARPLEGATIQLHTGNPPPNTAAIVVGWGARTAQASGGMPGNYPKQLHQVTVPIVSNQVCNQPSSYGGRIQPGMMCAGLAQGGRDACVGDSGGPLMVRVGNTFQQVGIVSQGEGCAIPGKYGVYTRVSSYIDWIRQYVMPPLAMATPSTQNDPKAVYPGGAGAVSPVFLILAGLLALSSLLRKGLKRAGHCPVPTACATTQPDPGTLHLYVKKMINTVFN